MEGKRFSVHVAVESIVHAAIHPATRDAGTASHRESLRSRLLCHGQMLRCQFQYRGARLPCSMPVANTLRYY